MPGDISRQNGKKGGRPKGPAPSTMDKIRAREYLRERVIADLGPLIDAQTKHAKGLSYLVARHKSTGKFEKLTADEAERMLSGEESDRIVVEVWEKDPSVQAFTDLLNRALDKPADQVQLSGADGGPLIVSWKK